MLKIKRIKIKNFRQFKDVELSFSNDKGIYLFVGKNGMGKSNFLNAICWCLYEKQPFKFHDKEKKLLNEEATRINKWDETSVSIEISLNDKAILFKRVVRESQNSVLSVMMKQKEDWDPVPNPNVMINNFLPESVQKFFLFDGEAVQNLYKGDYSEHLKAGVWIISNVELLDRASDNLHNTREELRKSLSKDEPSTQSLEDELAIFMEEKRQLEAELETKQKDLTKLKEDKDKFSEQLKQYDKYRVLQDKRSKIEAELAQTKALIDEYQRQINEILIENAPFWYIKEALSDVAVKINEEKNKGDLPPKIKSTFVKELLEKGDCICGRPIVKDSKEYQYLSSLLSDVESLDYKSFLLEDKPEINSLLREMQIDLYKKIKGIRKNRAAERSRINNYELQLKEIRNHLVNAPEKQVGDIESTIKRLENQIELTSQDIGQLKLKTHNLEQEINKNKNELDKLNKTKKEKKLELQKLDFLEEAKDKVDYIRDRMINQIRKCVSSRTDENFKELIWKKDEFDRINFTDDYKVEVLKKNDEVNSLEILSTGEMKVLSLATIKALADMSGFNDVPVFIDGPLENLDKEVRENFLTQLPRFIQNKQVFIFSLDSDLIEKFGQEIVPKENFFKLTRDGGSLSTVIKQYYNS